MNPSDVVEAIETAVAGVAVESRSDADVLRRVNTFSDVAAERQFVIRAVEQPDIPEPQQSGNCERVMLLEVHVFYGTSIERLLDDSELINDAFRSLQSDYAGAILVEAIERSVLTDPDTWHQAAVFNLQIRYTRG